MDRQLTADLTKYLVAEERIHPSIGTDNNVWMSVFVCENLVIFLNEGTAVGDRSASLGQILAEAGVLTLDLER